MLVDQIKMSYVAKKPLCMQHAQMCFGVDEAEVRKSFSKNYFFAIDNKIPFKDWNSFSLSLLNFWVPNTVYESEGLLCMRPTLNYYDIHAHMKEPDTYQFLSVFGEA